MGASFSSTVTSYSQRLLKSTSFNDTEPETELVGTAATTATTASPAQTTPNGSAPGDNQAQDGSKPILLGIAGAILTGSFALLTNPPKAVQNVILYNIYSLFLLPSFVLSIGSLFFILPTTPSKGTAWVRKMTLQIAFISLIISVILRIFLQLAAPIKWYEVLVPVLVLGGISMCLFIGWIKTNNSAEISSSVLASSVDEADSPV